MTKGQIITLVIFAGLVLTVWFLGSNPEAEKELIRKYELERKFHQDRIKELEAHVVDLQVAGEAIAEQRYQDSLKFASELTANKQAYNKLKREYEKINLSRASVQLLDSVRSGLPPLHTDF